MLLGRAFAKGGVGNHSAFRAFWPVRIACLAALVFANSSLADITPSGTVIRNVANVAYAANGVPRNSASNEFALTVTPAPTRAAISLLRGVTPLEAGTPGSGDISAKAGPTQCRNSTGTLPLPAPFVAGAGALDPTTALNLSSTRTAHAGDALFVRVADGDQNRDALQRDQVLVRVSSPVTGDSETILLSETDINSGVFVGYVPTRVGAAAPGDCVLELQQDSRVDARYVDATDNTDAVQSDGLVDPFGLLFDSATAVAIDGVRVRLIDSATGALAIVFGDDGVSRYPSEMITGSPVTDAGGTTYQLPAGRYRFPLVRPGQYRLEVGPPPSYSFASTVSIADLQLLPGAPFRLGDGSFGRSFAVPAGTATSVDIPLDPAGTVLVLTKTASASRVARGDFLQYTIELRNTSLRGPLRGITTLDRLPPGVRYRRGTLRVDDRAVEPVVSADGRELTINSADLLAGGSTRVRYVVEVSALTRVSEIVNVARAQASNGVQSNTAQIAVRVTNDLFTEKTMLLGRVVVADCKDPVAEGQGVAGVRIYLEDGRYVVTDDDGRYHFEGLAPGSHVAQVDAETLKPRYAMAECAASTRHAGRAASQFVSLRPGQLWRADFRLRELSIGDEARLAPAALRRDATTAPVVAGQDIATGIAVVRGLTLSSDKPVDRPPATLANKAVARDDGSFDVDLDTLPVQTGWLFPLEHATPAIASLKIAIAHRPAQSVALRINGEAVSDLNFDSTLSNRALTLKVSRWRGVDLIDGDNLLEAALRDTRSGEVTRLTRVVHYGGGAVRAELVREHSQLRADGRTRPVIALRMFDAYGKPARRGSIGGLSVAAPYRSWNEVERLRREPLLSLGNNAPGYEVGADGIAQIELEPTTETGYVSLQLRFNERRTQELRVWLEPAARDWILVALAQGSGAWRSVSQHIEPLPGIADPALATVNASADAATSEPGFDEHGRVAFFAKGRVRGDWLLTLAYDSANDKNAARERLKGVIEPDRYYLLYGDNTEQRFEAASTKPVYLKLERRQFVALFGDYDTGMTVTELTRYSRTLTGIKGDYSGDRTAVSAFAARTDLGLGRDELRGDGTSGAYRLSRSPLIIGSDKLHIEVRDRFRTERVIESRELSRFLDYQIDYETGELRFKEPVPSRDANFNPVFIIADYETAGTGIERTSAGGRASVKLVGGNAELGVSGVLNGALAGDTRIVGTDFKWQVGTADEVKAEFAQSRSHDPARAGSATAFIAEWQHITDTLDARAYVRQQDSGFGIGQQLATEDGTRKWGGEARYKFNSIWSLQGESFVQNNLATTAQRLLASGELRYQQSGRNVAAGLRHVDDQSPTGDARRSDQAYVTGSIDLLKQRLTLRASADAALNGSSESVDYPSRVTLGAEYKLPHDTSVFAEWEHADGQALRADMTRVGVRARPWERTQITSAVTEQASEYGPRTFANFGLTQSFRLDEHWSADFGFDQSRTMLKSGALQPLPQTPLASGSTGEDYFAAFAGAQFHDADWTTTARIEHRNAASEQRWLTALGVYREARAGRAFSVALQTQDSALAVGEDTHHADLRFGWAWRPDQSAWIVLNRLEFKRDVTAAVQESLRLVENMHANWQWGPRTQVGVQFGARLARASFTSAAAGPPIGATLRLTGLTSYLALDARHDLGARFDIGVYGASLHAHRAGLAEYSLGFDFGVTVVKNIWISLGYNLIGLQDDDFAAGRSTARGPFIQIRVKADQDTFKDLRLDSLRPAR